jgi:hypothetical protein
MTRHIGRLDDRLLAFVVAVVIGAIVYVLARVE